MYLPSDDSFLLAECASKYHGKSALEIGVGSGIVLSLLCKNFKIVAGTDINLEALRFCINNVPYCVLLACCDAASAFHYNFDLIVSNPPYLPNDNDNKKDFTVHGGVSGVETAIHIVKSATLVLAKHGKMLIVLSTFSNISKIDELMKNMRLKRRLIKERKLFFETLSVHEIGFR